MFQWYRLFNLTQFLDSGLISKEFEVVLSESGEVADVLVVQGNSTSVVYDDDMLTINLNDTNPFRLGEKAVFKDDNEDVWLGLYKNED